MKKIVTLVLAVCALSSCNFIAEKSDLYKNTLNQRHIHIECYKCLLMSYMSTRAYSSLLGFCSLNSSIH